MVARSHAGINIKPTMIGTGWKRETDPFEVRKKVLPAPSRIARLLPSIVVSGRATIKEHAIDDQPAADDSGRVDGTDPAIEARLRNALVVTRVILGYGHARYQDSGFLTVSKSGSQRAGARCLRLRSRSLAVHIALFNRQDRYWAKQDQNPNDTMNAGITDTKDLPSGFSVSRLATVKPLVPPPMIT